MTVMHNFGDKIKILRYSFVQNTNSKPKDVHTHNASRSNEQEITIIQNKF